MQLVILDFKTSNSVHDSYAMQVMQAPASLTTACDHGASCVPALPPSQLAAYVFAYREMHGNDPEVGTELMGGAWCSKNQSPLLCPDVAVGATVVRFDKTTGVAEVKSVKDLDASFAAFKAALYLWRTSNTQQFEVQMTSHKTSSALPVDEFNRSTVTVSKGEVLDGV